MSHIPSFRSKLEPLLPHLDDPRVTEIQINRPGEIWLRTHGSFYAERVAVPALTFTLLSTLAELTASYKSQEVGKQSPILSAELPVNLEDQVPDFERGTYRTEMILPPVTPEETVGITIRKQMMRRMNLGDYETAGAFRFVNQPVAESEYSDARLAQLFHDKQWEAFLKGAVLAKKTIVISAGTEAGKTTFLDMLLHLIPLHERLVLIEDSREVLPPHPNCLRLSYASPIGAATLRVTPTQLLRACMRLTPDRIIMGEVRGPEAVEYLNMLNTDHPGSITTVHANSPMEMFDRFAELMDGHTSMSRDQILARLQRRIDVVVQLAKSDRHGRYISDIHYAGA
ncbi:P-type DNA transfer ATPase VirB11 [Chromobacterium amazonense]|uniref:Type IV secretion system protein n=1 Tax=Chromobacterium amazonense TaxID=1382803 RepID=A0A2S9WZA5_9NEIS|nr:P-type DNA transfer ATPase VirB11 [Chromobacterium amazonense]PRP68798.1 P-type DNA transfer ATPase VirB11 [Chromobacterium amazonense]